MHAVPREPALPSNTPMADRNNYPPTPVTSALTLPYRYPPARHRTGEPTPHLTAQRRLAACSSPAMPSRRRRMIPSRSAHGQTSSSATRSEEHTSELQSRVDLVCRLL